MEVRKATPAETARMLVEKYDRLAGPGGQHDYSRPNHPKWGELAKVAALLADFVDAQFNPKENEK